MSTLVVRVRILLLIHGIINGGQQENMTDDRSLFFEKVTADMMDLIHLVAGGYTKFNILLDIFFSSSSFKIQRVDDVDWRRWLQETTFLSVAGDSIGRQIQIDPLVKRVKEKRNEKNIHLTVMITLFQLGWQPKRERENRDGSEHVSYNNMSQSRPNVFQQE